MSQSVLTPKQSKNTDILHASLPTATAQQRYRNSSLSSSSKSSWISDLKKLEQRLIVEEQNTDVFSLLAAEISDVKLAGHIKKIQIQDSQDTFNRELEMDDILSEIAAIRRQVKMIHDKLKENAADPQATKHWMKKAQEFEQKMDEFKLFQGQNFELIEKEEKELEEFIEEIRKQDHIQKSSEKGAWKPNVEEKPFRSMRNFIDESISKEEYPQKNSTEEEESSGIISNLDRQSVDFDSVDQTTIAEIAQGINDQEIARRQMLSKVTEKPEEENVGFSNKLSSEDSKTNNNSSNVRSGGIASNNYQEISSSYIGNVEDKSQGRQAKEITTENHIKQTKSEIIGNNNNSQFMAENNNQQKNTSKTRNVQQKKDSLKMGKEQIITGQQESQLLPARSSKAIVALSPIKQEQEQINTESKITALNSNSNKNTSLEARKDSLIRVRQSSQDLHQKPLAQPKTSNDSSTKFKNVLQSKDSSFFYDTPLKNNNSNKSESYAQQPNRTNPRNFPGSQLLEELESESNESPAGKERGQYQSSNDQGKVPIKKQNELNSSSSSFIQQNSLFENSHEEKSIKRKVIVIKKKNNDSGNIFSIKNHNITHSNPTNYMDLLNEQIQQSQAAQYQQQQQLLQDQYSKHNRSISLPKPRDKSSSLNKRATTSNQLSEECCQEVSRLAKIIAAQAEDEKDAEQLKNCVKKIEEAIESNGGMQCGWDDLEHRCFVYFVRKYGYQFHALHKLLKEDKGLQGLYGIPKGAMQEHQQRVEFRNQLLSQKSKYISEFQQVTSRIESSKQLQLQHQKKQHQFKFLHTPSPPKLFKRLNIHSSEGTSKYLRVTPEYKIDYSIRGISQDHPPAPQIIYRKIKEDFKIPQILSTPLKNIRNTTKSLSPQSNSSLNNLNRDNQDLEEMRNNLQAKLDQLNYLRAQTNSKKIPRYVYKNQQFFTPQIGRKNRNYSPSLLAMS